MDSELSWKLLFWNIFFGFLMLAVLGFGDKLREFWEDSRGRFLGFVGRVGGFFNDILVILLVD